MRRTDCEGEALTDRLRGGSPREMFMPNRSYRKFDQVAALLLALALASLNIVIWWLIVIWWSPLVP
jgi:hypothetical protein